MKRRILIPAASMAVLLFAVFATSALAAGGNDKIGPFAGASGDGGSCGNTWANLTYTLVFMVHDNGDGTFAVRTDYKDGALTTILGSSPGACNSGVDNGSTVAGGIKGKFQGWLTETVTSATYNPSACTAATCTTRTSFINATFGPAAGQTNFAYNFEYSSSDKSLKSRHWQDRSGPNDVSDQFVGDIAN